MGGIFSGPPSPPPAPDISAISARQDAATASREASQRRGVAARARARRTGGARQLVSQVRPTPTLGLPDAQQRTLGAARRPGRAV
jgi:hypothetical protein